MHHFKKIDKYEIHDQQLTLKGEEWGDIHIQPFAPGIVHIGLQRSNPWSISDIPASYSVISNDQELSFTIEEEDNRLKFIMDELYIDIQLDPFTLSYYRHDGVLLMKDIDGGIGWDGWKVGLQFAMAADDHFYGLGEPDQDVEKIDFDHRGHRRVLWNKHLPAPSRMMFPIFMNPKGYGIFIDNPWPSEIEFGTNDPKQWSYIAEGGYLNYYVMVGKNLEELMQKPIEITGKPTIPPRFTFGLLQSKFGYKSRKEVEGLAQTFREKKIPCDGIILDLYWFKKMGDLRFDQKQFPNPKEMIHSLKAKGFHTIVIEEPYVVKGSRLFAEGKKLEVFGKKSDGDTYTFPFWAGEAALVDFTNPLAKQWWANQHVDLIDMGIAGWWTDLNEPEEHPQDMIHDDGPAGQIHNIFALEMHKALQLAYDQEAPNKRLFIMSRSGWPGMQRFGAGTWSGDVETSWNALANQIVLGLNMGLAGIPSWNTDIGGFVGEATTPELYIRWMQFGAFTPIMRPHGAHADREPWNFGESAEKIVTDIIRLRYQLIPYIYTLAYEAYDKGLPFMRPLILYYANDPKAYHLTDQYLFGRDILVAPVTTEGRLEREVYLPEGNWIDFWTGKRFTGKQRINAAAPLEQIPLFIRAGSILPLLPSRDYIDQKEWSEIDLYIYPEGKSDYALYEDDGESNEYQEQHYTQTNFISELAADQWKLTIEKPIGTFKGQIKSRNYSIYVQLPFKPGKVAVNGEMNAGWFYDESLQTLKIDLTDINEEAAVLVGSR